MITLCYLFHSLWVLLQDDALKMHNEHNRSQEPRVHLKLLHLSLPPFSIKPATFSHQLTQQLNSRQKNRKRNGFLYDKTGKKIEKGEVDQVAMRTRVRRIPR